MNLVQVERTEGPSELDSYCLSNTKGCSAEGKNIYLVRMKSGVTRTRKSLVGCTYRFSLSSQVEPAGGLSGRACSTQLGYVAKFAI